MRAMILAAGLGTRMRPLSESLPKPLLPVANRPQLRLHLALLYAAGVREVMINTHHLAEAIPETLGDGSRYGMRLSYSREVEILGTGGGLKAVEHFLREPGEPFFVLNGDLMIEVSLLEVLALHKVRQAVATMVLREDPRAGQYGALGVDETGRIVDFVGRARAPGAIVRQGLFTGIHVLEPEVLDILPDHPCCINQTAYPRLIKEGRRVQAFFQQGFWSDVGTPGRYLEANMAILERRVNFPGETAFSEAAWAVDAEGGTWGQSSAVRCGERVEVLPPFLFGQNVSVGTDARLGPGLCVGAGAAIGAGATVARSVLWPGVEVLPGACIHQGVVWSQRGETRILTL